MLEEVSSSNQGYPGTSIQRYRLSHSSQEASVQQPGNTFAQLKAKKMKECTHLRKVVYEDYLGLNQVAHVGTTDLQDLLPPTVDLTRRSDPHHVAWVVQVLLTFETIA